MHTEHVSSKPSYLTIVSSLALSMSNSSGVKFPLIAAEAAEGVLGVESCSACSWPGDVVACRSLTSLLAGVWSACGAMPFIP